jgi:hypothetical protein
VWTAMITGRKDDIFRATAQIERALTWPSYNWPSNNSRANIPSVGLVDDQPRKKPPAASIRMGSREEKTRA